MRVVQVAAVLVGLAACVSPHVQSTVDAGSCVQDSDCPAGDYCLVPITPCPGVGPTASGSVIGLLAKSGTCQRDCDDDACTCTGDGECPGGGCTGGHCVLPYGCPAEDCPDQCPGGGCFTCLCNSCPDLDAGQCLTWPPATSCEDGRTCPCADGTTARIDCGFSGPGTCSDACCGHDAKAPDAGLADAGPSCATGADCEDHQVCVSYFCGPAPASCPAPHCADNPCGDEPLACSESLSSAPADAGCAASLCQGWVYCSASPDAGTLLCSVGG